MESLIQRSGLKETWMLGKFLPLVVLTSLSAGALAQHTYLRTDNRAFQVTNSFSDVDSFRISVEIAEPLTAGVYTNPDIVTVVYQVTGDLAPGTPSGFPAFDLLRTINGDEFYAQGGSLSFEISNSAVFSDGIQVTELIGDSVVLTFNAREIDNGRFHPVLFELNADGTGRLQNSNNIPSLDPLNEVDFGEEYITDLMFDPGNTTVITNVPLTDIDTRQIGSGSVNALELLAMLTLMLIYRARRNPSGASRV